MKSTRSLRRQLRALWVTNLVLFAAVCIAATPAVRPLLLDTSNHPTENVDFASSHWTGDPTSGKAINPASIGATTPGTGAFTGVTITLGNPGALTIDPNVNHDSSVALGGGQLVWAAGPGHFISGIPAQSLGLYAPAGHTIGFGDGGAYWALFSNTDFTLAGNLTASGYFSSDSGSLFSDGAGGLSISTTLTTLGGGTLTMGSDGGAIYTADGGGTINTGNGGGPINTGSLGGGIDTHNSGGSITTYIDGGSIDTSNYGGSIKTNGSGAPTSTTARVGSLYCDQNSPNTSGHTLWVKTASGWVGL